MSARAFGAAVRAMAGVLVVAMGVAPVACEFDDLQTFEATPAAVQQQQGHAHRPGETSDDADPCGDGCTCPCCPAHCLEPLASDPVAQVTPRDLAGHPPHAALEPRPSDFVSRLFRPPRAC